MVFRSLRRREQEDPRITTIGSNRRTFETPPLRSTAVDNSFPIWNREEREDPRITEIRSNRDSYQYKDMDGVISQLTDLFHFLSGTRCLLEPTKGVRNPDTRHDVCCIALKGLLSYGTYDTAPIEIYLQPPHFPSKPPVAYIRIPSEQKETLVFAKSHSIVHAKTGRIACKYLQSWDRKRDSSLVGFVGFLIEAFSNQTPVVWKSQASLSSVTSQNEAIPITAFEAPPLNPNFDASLENSFIRDSSGIKSYAVENSFPILNREEREDPRITEIRSNRGSYQYKDMDGVISQLTDLFHFLSGTRCVLEPTKGVRNPDTRHDVCCIALKGLLSYGTYDTAPIEIYLQPPHFPSKPPVAYIRNPPEQKETLVFAKSHAMVNPKTGRIACKYLQSWDRKRDSSLVGFVGFLIEAFSSQAPVVWKSGASQSTVSSQNEAIPITTFKATPLSLNFEASQVNSFILDSNNNVSPYTQAADYSFEQNQCSQVNDLYHRKVAPVPTAPVEYQSSSESNCRVDTTPLNLRGMDFAYISDDNTKIEGLNSSKSKHSSMTMIEEFNAATTMQKDLQTLDKSTNNELYTRHSHSISELDQESMPVCTNCHLKLHKRSNSEPINELPRFPYGTSPMSKGMQLHGCTEYDRQVLSITSMPILCVDSSIPIPLPCPTVPSSTVEIFQRKQVVQQMPMFRTSPVTVLMSTNDAGLQRLPVTPRNSTPSVDPADFIDLKVRCCSKVQTEIMNILLTRSRTTNKNQDTVDKLIISAKAIQAQLTWYEVIKERWRHRHDRVQHSCNSLRDIVLEKIIVPRTRWDENMIALVAEVNALLDVQRILDDSLSSGKISCQDHSSRSCAIEERRMCINAILKFLNVPDCA